MIVLYCVLGGLAALVFANALAGLMFKSYHSAEHCPWNWRLMLGVYCEPYFDWRDKNHPDWWRYP